MAIKDEIPSSVTALNLYVAYCGLQMSRNLQENEKLARNMGLAMDKLERMKEGL